MVRFAFRRCHHRPVGLSDVFIVKGRLVSLAVPVTMNRFAEPIIIVSGNTFAPGLG
jgi:hypothetical protein